MTEGAGHFHWVYYWHSELPVQWLWRRRSYRGVNSEVMSNFRYLNNCKKE